MNLGIDVENLYSEVVEKLEELAESESSEKRLEWFRKQHKGLQSYGIKTPPIRKLIKNYKNRFNQLTLKEKIELAKIFYESSIFEQAAIGDALVELSVGSMTPAHFDLLDEVTDCFNNWASVDWLCLHGLQSLLLKYSKETLELLRKWNLSENMWKRRASVVAFVWKIGASGEYTDEVLELCNNLIWDEEDLVKKGVGWALRDAMRGDKERVCEYVKSLRQKGGSSVITLYAVKDLKGRERKEILEIKPEKRTP